MSEFNRYLTESEERQLWNTMKNRKELFARRDYAWMRLLRQTGIRIGSLAGVTVQDAYGAIRNRSLPLRRAKGQRRYTVRVNRAARTALRELLALRAEQGHPQIPDSPLIMSRQGEAGMAVRTFQHRMKYWVEIAQLPVAATPHWFRHTLAKRLIARSTARDPLGIVQSALGHRTISSTGVYTRADREEVERAMEDAA